MGKKLYNIVWFCISVSSISSISMSLSNYQSADLDWLWHKMHQFHRICDSFWPLYIYTNIQFKLQKFSLRSIESHWHIGKYLNLAKICVYNINHIRRNKLQLLIYFRYIKRQKCTFCILLVIVGILFLFASILFVEACSIDVVWCGNHCIHCIVTTFAPDFNELTHTQT